MLSFAGGQTQTHPPSKPHAPAIGANESAGGLSVSPPLKSPSAEPSCSLQARA